MDTMDWKVEIKLVGPEGTVREELFLGRQAHDLAMLGAARGYVQGLYREAEATFIKTISPALD